MHALILSLAAALVAASVAIRVANRRRATTTKPRELADHLAEMNTVSPLHGNRRK